MKKIGITGAIGSGKTTVCKMFEVLGVPVYYADDRAKYLMNHNKSLKEKVKSLFGKEAYHRNGRLNRAKLASVVFNNKDKLKSLNALVHPAIHEDSESWFKAQKGKYAIKEAALIFETKGEKYLDKVIVVAAPEKIRIERVMGRDGVTAAQVKARMKNQFTQATKLKKADIVIQNGINDSLIKQVMKIHKKLNK
jgi:dephospho-CoA kinase